MSSTVDIGAARVRLVVDATEYTDPVARARAAMEGFGNVAATAYDKQSKGAQRAIDAARLYVQQLGKLGTGADKFGGLLAAEQRLDSLLRKAGRLGDTKIAPALAPIIAEWGNYRLAVERAAAAQEDFERGEAAGVAAAKQSKLLAQIELYERTERAARDAARAETALRSVEGATSSPSSGLRAGDQRALIAELQRQVQLEQQIEAEAHDINTEVNRWKAQLDAIGKDYYDIQIAQARLKFGGNAEPIVKQIEALRVANTTIHGTTVNAKQLQQAMRYLPAQFTDIGVSLASGMNPALVALQQGGQIMDQFRLAGMGAGDTLKAVGKEALAIVNPWTAAAAAVAAFGYAVWQSEQRMADFAVSAAKGGGLAGTAVQLKAVADEIDNLEYVTRGGADAAVKALGASAKLAGDNLKVAAASAAQWAAVTGEEASVVTAKFDAIAKGPLEAIESGTIRVTQEQYEYIKAIVATGDNQRAVGELVAIYAADNARHIENITANLGAMSREWLNVKDAVSEVWNGLMSGADASVGKLVELRNQFFELTKDAKESGSVLRETASMFARFAAQTALGKTGYDLSRELANRANGSAAKQAAPVVQMAGIYSATYDPEQAKRDKARADARQNYLDQGDREAQQRTELNRLEQEGIRLGFSKVERDAVAARKRAEWAEQDARRARGGTKRLPSGRDDTQAIKDQLAVEMAAMSTQTRQTELQWQARTISATAYYDSLRALATREHDATVAANNAQIAALAGKRDEERQVHTLRAANQRADEELARRKMELDAQQAQYDKQRREAQQQYVWALKDGTVQQERQLATDEAAITMSARQVSRMNAVNALYQEQHDKLTQLVRDAEQQKLTDEELYSRKQALLDETAIRLDNLRNSWKRQEAAEQSWLTGSQRAWQDWQDNTNDVAQKGYEMTTSAITGFSDAMTEALSGNLDGFKSFFEQLHKMILKFVIEQRLSAWMASLQQGGKGSKGGGWLDMAVNVIGAIWGGSAGSNTSVSTAGSNTKAFSGGKFAQGGVFDSGALAGFRNSIVSSPQVFPFARGGVPRWGLMGEAGPEAIMPLTRLPGGTLGVRAAESPRAAARGPVSIEQTFVVQGTPDRSTRDQLAKKVGRETTRAMGRN